MSSNTAEEPTAHVLAGSYYIRNGNNFLAVRNGSIVVQAQSYIWNVSVKGNLNYIQNPADSKFLHDETNENKLDPGQTLSGRWAGASVTNFTALINAETKNPLGVPYGDSADTWKFEEAT